MEKSEENYGSSFSSSATYQVKPKLAEARPSSLVAQREPSIREFSIVHPLDRLKLAHKLLSQ